MPTEGPARGCPIAPLCGPFGPPGLVAVAQRSRHLSDVRRVPRAPATEVREFLGGDLHVRGYKEEGTTTTPFDKVMLNDLDRFHLVSPRCARR